MAHSRREMEKLEVPRFDEKSQLWLQPFSEIINSMFPMEYVYGEWIWWQATNEARCVHPESLASKPVSQIETGSRVEGFCIPQFYVGKTENFMSIPFENREHWQPDADGMKNNDYVVENMAREVIPNFTVEHVPDDPRYVHLRFTDEWKELKPRYKNATFVNHTYLIPNNAYDDNKLGQLNEGRKPNEEFTYEMHGPVRKLQAKGFPSYEEDQTGVFKYPLGWPDEAKEWLVRPRVNGWPSPELLQDILHSGCHLAPVGRGKRQDEPLEFLEYIKKPQQGSTSRRKTNQQSQGLSIMDETEWRLSFSVAENKLGQSVSPVQRHVLVLLKMIKKAYFPDVISSYLLKNLLFWEIEKQDQSFWIEGNSAKCLLLLLDRLQKSLEEGHLPHYIIPQSNLLQYEDPAKLAEGASIICDVRTKILPKTISLLKRCFSLTYQSKIFTNDLQDLEPLVDRVQDKFLTEDKVARLICSLLAVFMGKSKDVIQNVHESLEKEGETEIIKKMMHIPLNAYESILARSLCKLWHLKTDKTNEDKSSQTEFTSFAKEEVKHLSLDDEFFNLAQLFFTEAKESRDMSLMIPHTIAMEHTKEAYKKIAWHQVEEAQVSLDEKMAWLTKSDLHEIMQNVGEKLKGQLENLTMEYFEAETNKELQIFMEKRQQQQQQQKENTESDQEN